MRILPYWLRRFRNKDQYEVTHKESEIENPNMGLDFIVTE